jgi:hypothetical protein
VPHGTTAIDWAGWAVFGLVSTAMLTAGMEGAQLLRRSRMDLPLLLGTIFVGDFDRARLVGFATHLVIGQAFALLYAAAFALLGFATWWLGAVFGLVHGLLALLLLVPLLAGLHPRMASDRSGPDLRMLEPPGPLALNYGRETPLVTVAAHVLYGALLGALLKP